MALRRKRARRVSFADNEITSVHIFRRDDSSSSDTPPNSVPSSSAKTAPTPDVLVFFRDLAGDSDDDDLKESSSPPSHDDGEVADGSDSFLRPVGSPSPGGSSAAASTDDGEFRNLCCHASFFFFFRNLRFTCFLFPFHFLVTHYFILFYSILQKMIFVVLYRLVSSDLNACLTLVHLMISQWTQLPFHCITGVLLGRTPET